MEISGPRIGLRAMQLETVLAHVSQQLITCGRVRKHLTVRPEVGAVCEKDACPDLCGGREVTCVPTATAQAVNSQHTPSCRCAPLPTRSPVRVCRRVGTAPLKARHMFRHCTKRLCPPYAAFKTALAVACR